MLNDKNKKIIIRYIKQYQELTSNVKVLDISNDEYLSFDIDELNCEKMNIEDFIKRGDKRIPNRQYDFILYFDNTNSSNAEANLDFIKNISKKCRIFLTNLVLTDVYDNCKKVFSYWNETEFYFEHIKGKTPTYRPIIFASNEYCLSKEENDIQVAYIKENSNIYHNDDCYYINEKSIYDTCVDNNIFFKKELLIYSPFFIACNSIKNNFDLDLKKHINIDKEVEKTLLEKNEIGSMYRIYFNKVLKTSFYLDKKHKVYSKTRFINTSEKEVTNGKIIIVSGIKRYLINGRTLADVINENIDDKKICKKQFESFLLEVFKKYRTEYDDLLLSTCLNSVTLQNCLLVDNEYIFFDEKHKLKDKYVDKSYVLFSSIFNSPINDLSLKNELYIYFSLKFKLKYKPKEFLEYQKNLWNWNGIRSYDISKMHLVETIKKLMHVC